MEALLRKISSNHGGVGVVIVTPVSATDFATVMCMQ